MDAPDEAVEAAARAMYQIEVDEAADVGMTYKPWDRLPEACQATHTDTATAALEAAAPFIAAQEVFRIETQAPRLTYAQLEWLARRREELEPK